MPDLTAFARAPQNTMRAYAARFNAAAIGVDMPGHGRSDGLWVHIPDWMEFVDAAAVRCSASRAARPGAR